MSNEYIHEIKITEELYETYISEHRADLRQTPMLNWFIHVCDGSVMCNNGAFYFTQKEDAIEFKMLFC